MFLYALKSLENKGHSKSRETNNCKKSVYNKIRGLCKKAGGRPLAPKAAEYFSHNPGKGSD
jgi:hypothetical protein